MRTVTVLVAATALALATAGAASANVHQFPSSSSTVVGSCPVVDDKQIGYFWSATLGHRVEQFFADPEPEVGRAITNLQVLSNLLNPGLHVDWEIRINQVPVGGFSVQPGFTGPITVDTSFPAIPAAGGGYDVVLQVVSDVPFGEGSHTLAYADPFAHSITLIPEPATLALLAVGGLALARRRAR